MKVILGEMGRRETVFWAWTRDEWIALLQATDNSLRQMVRAVVVVWLFAGLRVDELARLRVGCVRWQRPDATIDDSDSVPSSDLVCLLSVPAHKTEAPFTKPVDRLVGEAILAWEQVRPAQPPFVDPKTGEVAAVLLAYRGRRMKRT